MKIQNFKLAEVLGKSPMDWRFRATVDVTSGFFKKKTVTREIFKEFGNSWYFVDTGEFTPGYYVENLVRAFEATTGKPIECHDT